MKNAILLILALTISSGVISAVQPNNYTLRLVGKASGEDEKSRLQLDMALSDFEYTGLYLPPNQTVSLQVEAIMGKVTPSLVIGTYGLGILEPRSLKLKLGSNTISDKNGGMLYLRFPNRSSQARFIFSKNLLQVPTYRLGKTTNADWKKQLASLNPSSVPVAALLGKRELIVVSRQSAVTYQDKNQDELLRLLDTTLEIEDTISGLSASQAPSSPYLMVEHDDPTAYFYATDYYTAFLQDDVRYILDPQVLRQDGWGVWHELGHMHQQSAWTWAAADEVTVNIYSLAVQRFLKQPSRMTENWAEVDTYLALPDAARDYNADSTDDFVRLGMFEQLRLAFGDGFYQELHRQTRAERPVTSSDAAKIAYFALKSSQLAQRDLSGFYAKWGLKLSSGTRQKIATLRLAPPEQDLTTPR